MIRRNLEKLVLIIGLLVIPVAVMSQSRTGEIKILPRIDDKAPKDSLEAVFEERPYFLLIDQSEKALEQGDYESAALRLVEAMSVEPENELNVALLSNLGMIYFYNEQDSLALEVLERAIERSPRLIAPREGRARVLVSNGRDGEAYREYGNILEIDSLHTDALFVHGMMSLYSSKLDEAKHDIALLKKLKPQSKESLLAEATMMSMTGFEVEAVSLFKRLIEKEPAPEYYSQLVACELALDNLADAAEFIAEWGSKYPNDAEMYYYRALLNKKRYLLDEAHRDARQAIKLGADREKVSAIFN